MMDEQPKIFIDDVRRAGHCVIPGTRDWFNRHGLDFKDFIKNGISEEKFLASGDALAVRIVEKKKALTDGQK